MVNKALILSLPDDQPLLRAGDVRLAETEIERAEVELRRAKAEVHKMERALAQKKERISTIYELLGKLDPQTNQAKQERKRQPTVNSNASSGRRVTWTSAILNAVDSSQAGFLSYDEIREVLRNGPLADKLAKSEKSFHGALGKLHDANKIVRYKEHAFVPVVHAHHIGRVQRGEISDVRPASASRNSPLQDAIVAALGRTDDYLTGSALIDLIIEIGPPAVARSLRRNSNGLYNALSRMLKRGDVIKDERTKTYRLPVEGDAEKESTPEPHGSGVLNGGAATPLNRNIFPKGTMF